MKQIKNGTASKSLNGKLRILSIVLASIGAIDAIYLLILKYSQSDAMCIGSHGCITVNNSPYSMIYGIPISLLGSICYLIIGLVLILETRLKFLIYIGPLAVFGLSLAGTLFSAYLTYLEYFVILAVCPFCVTSAIVMTLVFILSVVRLAKNTNK